MPKLGRATKGEFAIVFYGSYNGKDRIFITQCGVIIADSKFGDPVRKIWEGIGSQK